MPRGQPKGLLRFVPYAITASWWQSQLTHLAADEEYVGANPTHDFNKPMPKHEREDRDEANFHPVDGIRGHCKCGNYMHYISFEGEMECDECGRVWNVYVDHDLWEEPQ